MRLFISYARVDKLTCEKTVQHLARVHEVWYDQRLHAGYQWWEEIERRLAWCEGFVYLLSPESIESDYCQREFALAEAGDKYLFPVVIRKARGNTLAIPDSLKHLHYADLSDSWEQMEVLKDALTVAERLPKTPPPPAPTPTPAPASPAAPPGAAGTVGDAIERASALLDAGDTDRAAFALKAALEQNPSERQRRILTELLREAEAELTRQSRQREAEREYRPIAALVKRQATKRVGCAEFAEFRRDFPEYDPDGLAALCTAADILPAPFAWVEIPAGKVTLEYGDWLENENRFPIKYNVRSKKAFDMSAYAISKYPTTNAQYAQFIEAGGYAERRWWTAQGWALCEKERWTQPRFWTDEKWNGPDHPVVGVSWYEAVAFCTWLSAAAGERVMLPTEQQWQRAAQGNDGRAFPWGNDWDAGKCNNNVDQKGIGRTTAVTAYPGGASPFGVFDLSGNVWEWCLTSYAEESNDINMNSEYLVLRGGSWLNGDIDNFRASSRSRSNPNNRNNVRGFRCARS